MTNEGDGTGGGLQIGDHSTIGMEVVGPLGTAAVKEDTTTEVGKVEI